MKTRKGIDGIPPYVPGKTKEEIAKKYGLDKNSIIKMGSNENPLGPSERAVLAIEKNTVNVSVYPENTYTKLRSKIAGYVGVKKNQVIVGNGSDEVLDMAVKMFMEEGSEAVIPTPTFSMYRKLVELYNGKCAFAPLRNDFKFDVDAILEKITENTSLAIICSPNNPTGSTISEGGLRRILERDIAVILDEAYAEFSSESLVKLVREYNNLVVLRTFSKAFGLAGLRAGYGVADSRIISLLLRIKIPFSLNLLAEKAAIAALEDRDHLKRSVELARAGRDFLLEELTKIKGIRPYPSQANFIFMKLNLKADSVVEALYRKGIIVRDCSSGDANYIRVSTGTMEDNKKFLKAFREVI
ncbi:MAG: histidinol-phosphate transaminase [Candidatus Hydrothermarchaeaceae archaeon]